jgi:hypothetical protein
MLTYRAIALALAVTFAAVGLAFLAAPGSVNLLFERAARVLPIGRLPAGGLEGGLFPVLAAAYMYLVAWLSWMTFRRPKEAAWPLVLAQAKLASAVVSIALAAAQGPSLALAANAVVDGLLGGLALWLRRQALRRARREVVAA